MLQVPDIPGENAHIVQSSMWPSSKFRAMCGIGKLFATAGDQSLSDRFKALVRDSGLQPSGPAIAPERRMVTISLC
jgi:hypothetical protein